ncbi:CHAT domain-containing protein [Micromonospora sp. NPDC003816]|uniref:CHAT domain-containing protein n=1 Tax=Micromonospora sp. NPDC003816 TaxID=3364224 RepID=UPI0036A7BCE3
MTGIPDAWGTPQYHLLVGACGQAEAHHDSYERTGSLRDLEFALAVFTEVLRVARNVDIRSTAANGLGTARWSRYERFGDLADLDAAVGLFRDALAMYPNERTPATPSFHANLGGVLRLRWRRTGVEADLVESVTQVRAALAATGPTHPRRAGRLTNLADGLLTLSLRYDDSSALAEAVEVSREAVTAAGPGDDLAGMLSNLAEILRLRYRSTNGRERVLLDEAVERGREAVAAAGDRHPLRARFESNLALVLVDRYAAGRHPADLAEAGRLAEHAVRATPEGHPNRAERMLVLAGIRRAEVTRLAAEVPRLREARRLARAARDAAAAVPEGHYLRADALLGEAAALTVWAVSGEPKAYQEAITILRRVARDPTAPVRVRVEAARRWANALLASSRGRDLAGARQAYHLAVELLPRTAPRRVTHADRERHLGAFVGLARDAAACAISAGDPLDALRLLEHGRGVLLGHALDARTELTELRRRRADLADRFEAVRNAFDRPEGIGFSSLPDDLTVPGEDRHALARDWDALLEEIRGVDDLAGFLRPPPVDDLLAEIARRGPVVVLNISGLRCDALVLAGGGVRVVPLRLSLDQVVDRARRLRAAVTRTNRPSLPAPLREEARSTVAETLDWLWATVAAPVLDVLAPPSGSRLWWVPTGPLTSLPLHAAGPADGPGVLDRVVSSYAPTVRSLVTAWRSRPAARTAVPLVVALPQTPGLGDLPNVPTEVRMLTARYPGSAVLLGARAVRRSVLDALPRHPWLHFAGHAVSAADGSADGHLVLHDHAAAPLTVADIARLRLTRAEIAYLSACDTGVSHEDLDDEALHVAGACHIAGFRHVVGTAWAIDDAVAPGVAADFYARLSGADDAASALHQAVRTLRAAQPDRPALWAPFLHVGP